MTEIICICHERSHGFQVNSTEYDNRHVFTYTLYVIVSFWLNSRYKVRPMH